MGLTYLLGLLDRQSEVESPSFTLSEILRTLKIEH